MYSVDTDANGPVNGKVIPILYGASVCAPVRSGPANAAAENVPKTAGGFVQSPSCA
jgi:hypothetical protein